MKKNEKASIYQRVTDKMIASLEGGEIPWEKPWQSPKYKGGIFPRNFLTGKPYRGINVMLLWGAKFNSPFWVTFKQAQELGGTVRKGERSEQIVFYKQIPTDKLQEQPGDENKRRPFILTHYNVFNTDQCDGLSLPEIKEPARNPVDTDATCEDIVSRWADRPVIRTEIETEYRAYYRPSTDTVHLPARFRFLDTAHYYATLFHELVHSTGHEKRLARTGGSFGDELYSKEELVAEMGAAFLCAIAGISTDHTERNTVAYLQNWIGALKKDNRLIFQAAGSAQRAVDMICGESVLGEEEEESAGDAGTDQPFSIPIAA